MGLIEKKKAKVSDMEVVSFSGGKDSTAMLLMALENNEDIHSVVYYDTEHEFPEILEHMEKMRKLPVEFVTVRNYIGTDFWLNRYGKPHASGGWCTEHKRAECDKYVRLIKKDYPDITECIGFTADEKHRAKLKKKWTVRYPLIEAKMSEMDCLQYCYDRGYDFGGIYEWMPSKRVSCYDCPKQGKKDVGAIKKHHPEIEFKFI